MKHPGSLAQISFAITALFFAAVGEAQPATLLTLSPPEVIYDGEDGVLSLHRTATRVFVDARGTAYLPDWKDGGVFAFSPDARTPRRVGGKGSGPGEFIGASALGWLGDTLWVSDSRNNRITMIARWGQGTATNSHLLGLKLCLWHQRPQRVDP